MGLELRFRLKEIEGWLARMEQAEISDIQWGAGNSWATRTAIGTYSAITVRRRVSRPSPTPGFEMPTAECAM
ncbi:MAG: hypothetical protein WBG36_17145 [Ornithinimicrobium sp.]